MTAPVLPKPFWDDHYEENPQWKEFRQKFEVYMTLHEHHHEQRAREKLTMAEQAKDDVEDRLKATIDHAYPQSVRNLELWSILGDEGRRQFDTIEDSENYPKWKTADMITKCNELFGKEEHPMIAFHDLFTWKK